MNTFYDPSFAIRGLHFDLKTGFLLKVLHAALLNVLCFVLAVCCAL